MPRPVRAALAVTAALTIPLAVTAPSATAAPIYTTKTGAIPSGGNGAPEPGGGARITNKAFGYYIGRAKEGSHFTRLGGRASHYYGRIAGQDVNLCGWLHHSALGTREHQRGKATCSHAVADRIWQRTMFGRNFSAPAGTKHHSGVRVPAKSGCPLFYNYFTTSTLRHGTFRTPAPGTIGTAPSAPGTVKYRYQIRDGKAVVVYDDALGWGFTYRSCVTLRGINTYNDADKGKPPKF
jgi:hypothetical protein